MRLFDKFFILFAFLIASAVVAAAFVTTFVLVAYAFPALYGLFEDGTTAASERAAPNASCDSSDLLLSAHFGTSGASDGLASFEPARADVLCKLAAPMEVYLADTNGAPINAERSRITAQYELAIRGEAGHIPQEAWLLFTWMNWCTAPVENQLLIVARLADGSELRAKVAGLSGTYIAPPCDDAARPSRLGTGEGLRGELLVKDAPWCRADELSIRRDLFSQQDDDEHGPHVEGGGFVLNGADMPCRLPHVDSLEVTDADGRVLKSGSNVNRTGATEPFIVGPRDLHVFFRWSRWCDDAVPGPLQLRAKLAHDGGYLAWDLPGSSYADHTAITPPCKGSGTLYVETWSPP